MSTSTVTLTAAVVRDTTDTSLAARARAYFASDRARTLQTVLGLIWLLDGALQFQSFMYSKGFIDSITVNIPGQPGWLGSSIRWSANIAAGNLTLYNTLFAVTQVLIGAGLLWRRSAKPALVLSFVWALTVWWFGEAFGMLFMNMASPLTGAPGAVILYAIVGLIAWPNQRFGGLLGPRGAKTTWAVLWLLMAWLWLEAPSSSANATTNAINAAPSGMSWLSTVQNAVAKAAQGDGLVIAFVLALVSVVIGIGVATDRRPRTLLSLAIVVNLAYWVFGQGFGGIFEGGATDPNAGLLFCVLAYALYPFAPSARAPGAPDGLRAAPALASPAGAQS
jgi:hypothetical protein